MTSPEILACKPVLINSVTQPEIATLVFAHGAGAAMDSQVMSHIANALSLQQIKVIRFEFDYMAERRISGKRAPPPKIEKLAHEWQNWLSIAIPQLQSSPIFIGGKSMGGRVATLMNSQAQTNNTLNSPAAWQGVCCIGYPFHPNGQPEKIRTAHLHHQQRPIIITQGTRDAFGNGNEVAQYQLPNSVKIAWLDSADHDLKPLKKSGLNQAQTIEQAANVIAQFIEIQVVLMRSAKDLAV